MKNQYLEKEIYNEHKRIQFLLLFFSTVCQIILLNSLLKFDHCWRGGRNFLKFKSYIIIFRKIYYVCHPIFQPKDDILMLKYYEYQTSRWGVENIISTEPTICSNIFPYFAQKCFHEFHFIPIKTLHNLFSSSNLSEILFLHEYLYNFWGFHDFLSVSGME